MCIAIPMEVIEIRGGEPPGPDEPGMAVVRAQGVEQEVRLDIVDRWPKVGDYVIVHAGFAIHSLEASEAQENLRYLREMAEGITDDIP